MNKPQALVDVMERRRIVRQNVLDLKATIAANRLAFYEGTTVPPAERARLTAELAAAEAECFRLECVVKLFDGIRMKLRANSILGELSRALTELGMDHLLSSAKAKATEAEAELAKEAEAIAFSAPLKTIPL